MRVSVVLPTHNRPGLLREALGSLTAQSWAEWELVVVDDGSIPPVDPAMAAGFQQPVQWLQNTPAQGLSAARNKGMTAATGDVVTFLDDDDLLAPDTLERIATQFLRHPELECLFVNIDPFGTAGQGMRDNQAHTLHAALERLGAPAWAQANGDFRPLGKDLFEALLSGLPLAFQRVAIRRSTLERTGLYQLGPFGDLEWNYRLALRCHCALLSTPLYRVRCDGQSFFTRGDAHAKLLNAAIRIRLQLMALPEVAARPPLATKVGQALARARFDKAYFAYSTHGLFPWRDFFLSMRHGPGWRHASLLAKVLRAGLGCRAAEKAP
jgi:glycosyltransferase involved in cell wall biosynthesis